MKTKIYFISDGEYIKIGISIDPQKRLSSLQTANPRKLELLHTIEFETSNEALLLEQNMHRYLDSYSSSGEWFKASWQFIHSQIDYVRALMNEEKRKYDETIIEELLKDLKTISKRARKYRLIDYNALLQIVFNQCVDYDIEFNYPPYWRNPK